MILLDELEEHALIKALAPAHRTALAQLAQLREFEPGAVIFREGQRCPVVYLVLSGEVGLEIALPDRRGMEVQAIDPGELLGWSPVIGGGPMTATAVALSRCRLAALEAQALQKLWEQQPRYGVEFLRQVASTMADRLQATRREVGTHRRSLQTLPLEEGGMM